MNQELAHTEEREGFTIRLYLCEEDISPADSFMAEDLPEVLDKIERGVWIWFCAKVTASKAGVELGTDYLGACCYESAEAFVAAGDYWDDMVSAAIAEARETLAKLCGT